MITERTAAPRATGAAGIFAGWLVLLVLLPPTIVTYARLPAGATYHFDATGLVGGGLSRTLTELNYPVAVGAIALALAAHGLLASRRSAIAAAVAVALCLVAFWPGVVSTSDLTARWTNLPAAAGCAVALGLCVAAVLEGGGRPGRGRAGWDRLRVAVGALAVVWALPWVWAALGLSISDTPILGDVFRASQPTPGAPALASVHLGLHEGLAGVQLMLVALLVSRLLPSLAGRPRLRTALSLYLGLMLAYGTIVAANDGWNEQLVKRGTVGFQLPYLLVPSIGWGWACLLLAAVAIHLVWFRRECSAATPA